MTINSQERGFRTVDIRPVEAGSLDTRRLAQLKLPVAPFALRDGSFFDGPLLPRLLHADDGGREGVTRYVETFGPDGLLTWVADEAPSEVQKVMGDTMFAYLQEHGWEFQSDGSSFEHMLEAGLGSLAPTDAFARLWQGEAEPLRDAMSYAGNTATTVEQAARYVLASESVRAPKVSVELIEFTGSPMLMVRPETVWDRAWLEAIDLLMTRGQRPVECGWCGSWFPPRTLRELHCPGVDCGQRAARHNWDGTDFRRGYHRMYKRMRRGTISRAEFDEWTQANRPSPLAERS